MFSLLDISWLACCSPTSRSKYVFALSSTSKTMADWYPLTSSPRLPTNFFARDSASLRETLKSTDASGNARKKYLCANTTPTMPSSTHSSSSRLSELVSRSSATEPPAISLSQATHTYTTSSVSATVASPGCPSSRVPLLPGKPPALVSNRAASPSPLSDLECGSPAAAFFSVSHDSAFSDIQQNPRPRNLSFFLIFPCKKVFFVYTYSWLTFCLVVIPPASRWLFCFPARP